VPVKVVRKILPVDGTAALKVPPAALTLTVPVGATATLAPALTTPGVIVIVPPELGAALLTSERSWVLLETKTAGPELRRLFTTVVALLETFAVTEPTVESGAVPVKPATPPLRLAPKSPAWPTVLAS
jgi:hypothetical protein